jgi:hypothetical protein
MWRLAAACFNDWSWHPCEIDVDVLTPRRPRSRGTGSVCWRRKIRGINCLIHGGDLLRGGGESPSSERKGDVGSRATRRWRMEIRRGEEARFPKDPLMPPPSTSLLLWLQGRPGCSGLVGDFFELGPYLVNPDGASLSCNPFARNRRYGLLFVDSPLGTGFSAACLPPPSSHASRADDTAVAAGARGGGLAGAEPSHGDARLGRRWRMGRLGRRRRRGQRWDPRPRGGDGREETAAAVAVAGGAGGRSSSERGGRGGERVGPTE